MTMRAIMKMKVQGIRTAPRMRPNFSFRFILDEGGTRELEKVLDVCYWYNLILNIRCLKPWLRGIRPCCVLF